MNDLVDTTEMYLRTILELEEEGVPPLRARIAERLHQSGPTVSQTVARMERDGLLTVEGDRHLAADRARPGQARVAVMRKHRLAELLLVNVIGMPYEEAHDEACRWEHVMSDAVEQKVYELLDRPTRSPYGNPIPGLDELGSPLSDLSGVEPRAQPGLPRPHRQGRRAAGSARACRPTPTCCASCTRPGVDPGATVDGGAGARRRDRSTATATRCACPREVASRVFVATR